MDNTFAQQTIYSDYLKSQALADQDMEHALIHHRKHAKAYFQPLLPKDPSAHILDLGCGYGALLLALQENGYSNTTGIDISTSQVQAAKEKLGLDCIELGDAVTYLKTVDTRFDAILAIDLIEHLSLETKLNLLSIAHSKLKPEGALIVQVPNGLCPMAPTFHGDITHQRAYSPQSIKQTLRMAGFQHIRVLPVSPIPAGVKSSLRAFCWHSVVKPAIALYCLAAYGTTLGGIYTPNLIAYGSTCTHP